MENERLEIEKRIKTISSETLGSYFSKQVSQRYPEEYQKFQEHRDQVRNYSSNATTISDLKARFTKVSEDLQFYKGVLPVYENYYQRFEEMKKNIINKEQLLVKNNSQLVILNLLLEKHLLKISNKLFLKIKHLDLVNLILMVCQMMLRER